MHILHEIFTERNEKQDSQYTAKQRTQENLEKANGDFRIFGLQDIKRRKGENRPGNNHAGTCPDRLDNHILTKGVLFAKGTRKPHGDNGDGDGGLEHLPYLKTEIGSGGTENHTQHQTHDYGINSNLLVLTCRMHQRPVMLVGTKLTERVFRKFHGVSVGINHFLLPVGHRGHPVCICFYFFHL